jgi:hypothetical protein
MNQQEQEYNFRHLISKKGEYGATIAYSDPIKIGDSFYIQMNFSICSKNDTFSRKKGRETVLNRMGDESYLISYHHGLTLLENITLFLLDIYSNKMIFDVYDDYQRNMLTKLYSAILFSLT